jgi:hypothetical protein
MKLIPYALIGAFACIVASCAFAQTDPVPPLPPIGEKWTESNIRTFCVNRWLTNPRRYEICIQQNSDKVDTDISPAERKELQQGPNPVKKNAKPAN